MAIGSAVLVVPFLVLLGYAVWVLWQSAATGIVQGFPGRFSPAAPVHANDTLSFSTLVAVWSLLAVTAAVMATWLGWMAIDSYGGYVRHLRREETADRLDR